MQEMGQKKNQSGKTHWYFRNIWVSEIFETKMALWRQLVMITRAYTVVFLLFIFDCMLGIVHNKKLTN